MPGGIRPGAGRPPGSKNMLGDLRTAIREICAAKNYDPLEELINIVQDVKNRLTLDQKITIHKELLQYVAPKLKAVDIQANVQGDIVVKVVRYSEDGTVIPGSATVETLPSSPTPEQQKIIDVVGTEMLKAATEDDDEDQDDE